MSDTIGTLSVDPAGVVTLTGYAFEGELAWPFDPVRSRAIRALDVQIEALEALRRKFTEEIGIKGVPADIVEIAKIGSAPAPIAGVSIVQVRGEGSQVISP